MTKHMVVIVLVAAGSMVTSSLAQEDAARSFLNPTLGQAKVTASHTSKVHFREDIGGQGTHMSFAEHELQFRLPIYQNETREWTLNTLIKSLDFDTNARLPRKRLVWLGDEFPDHLWDLRLGTTLRQKLDNDWLTGIDLSIGSPSDRPFRSLDEVAVNTTGFLRIPDGERNAWLFFLNWSNNREFWQYIPLPGVAYQYEPDDTLSTVIGVPYSSARYVPIDWLEFDASYFVPRTVLGRLSILPARSVRIYGGYEWKNQRYFRHDRDNKDDRLFYYEQCVKAGVRWDITNALYVDLSGGYAFDRFFFEGEKYSDRSNSRINMSDGPFAAAQLVFRF